MFDMQKQSDIKTKAAKAAITSEMTAAIAKDAMALG